MRIVIVGAGQAGASAVRTLRAEGFDGEVVLVGGESSPPYERPPLSKEYLQGEEEFESTLILEEEWYPANDVELRLSTYVQRLRPSERKVELDDGSDLSADVVMLATGGRPRRFPDVDFNDRIMELRTRDDADQIRDHLSSGRRLIVIGGGFIGSEIASAALAAETEVTVFEALAVPLERAVGPEVGAQLAQLYRDAGVNLITNVGVHEVASNGGGVRVRTEDDEVFEADAAVFGIGMVPNTELAKDAGLTVEDGIVVDALCRTSVEGIYAAGDVARQWHPLYDRYIRVEHFDNANKQAAAAARSILGNGAPYDEPHWFWSDQYECNLQYVGHAHEWDQVVMRGWPEDNEFSAWYFQDGRLLATFALEASGDILAARELITQRAHPDPAAIADIDTDLFELAGLT